MEKRPRKIAMQSISLVSIEDALKMQQGAICLGVILDLYTLDDKDVLVFHSQLSTRFTIPTIIRLDPTSNFEFIFCNNSKLKLFSKILIY